LTTTDPDLTIVDGEAMLGPVTIGGEVVCPPESIRIHVATGTENHRAPLRLAIGPAGETPAQLFDITLQIGTPPLLVFDDDDGQDREAYVAATLDSLGMLYDVWDDGLGLFPAYPLAELDFDPYDAVLWLTGDVGNTLDEADVARVHAILDGGGHLLLSGQDVAESLGTFSEGQALLAEVGIAWDGRENLSGIFGVEADPVFDGLKFATSGYGFDGANNQTSRDRLQVTGDAEVCLTYQTGHPAAVRREWGDARVLFVGFGVEAVVDNNPSVNTRREFLAAALDYLVNGITGAEVPSPTVLRITGLWPNPTTGEIRAALATPSLRSGLRVVLLDLAGRQVDELFDTEGLVPPVLSLRLPDAMPSGAYLVRFETQGSRTTLPVTVIR
ncbi:T9SS type A sorting domain-containing protein, partial [Candidatus Fermentibacteria bacterium]|nr:T9SS type A sorting domain-containing protein [Candidatus Fermentibacteria bacterium]